MLKLQTLPTQALAGSRENIVARWLARPVAVLLPLIALSSLVRSAVAWKHRRRGTSPTSTSMRRSAARSRTATTRSAATSRTFPAILEPLLAAPLWRFFSTETAYHLVQAENAVAASLVAVPVYLLARWLGLGRGYSYLCAAYGLLIPAVSLAAENLTDLVAYPLVLAAIAVGVRALDTPSPKRQVAFLAFATLATLARTQYFVLVPAYILAALLLERRRMFRAAQGGGARAGSRRDRNHGRDARLLFGHPLDHAPERRVLQVVRAAGVPARPRRRRGDRARGRDRVHPADPPPRDRLLAARRRIHGAAVLRVGRLRGELGRVQGALSLHARCRCSRSPTAST